MILAKVWSQISCSSQHLHYTLKNLYQSKGSQRNHIKSDLISVKLGAGKKKKKTHTIHTIRLEQNTIMLLLNGLLKDARLAFSVLKNPDYIQLLHKGWNAAKRTVSWIHLGYPYIYIHVYIYATLYIKSSSFCQNSFQIHYFEVRSFALLSVNGCDNLKDT